jgi:small subunit ribosomal protein S20
MPQHKSCKKRMKTDARRREHNRAARSALRRVLRRYRELSADDRAGAYRSLVSTLDKAAGKGLISRNKAARLKSRCAPPA